MNNIFKYIYYNTYALTFMESKVGGKEGASVVNLPYPSFYVNSFFKRTKALINFIY